MCLWNGYNGRALKKHHSNEYQRKLMSVAYQTMDHSLEADAETEFGAHGVDQGRHRGEQRPEQGRQRGGLSPRARRLAGLHPLQGGADQCGEPARPRCVSPTDGARTGLCLIFIFCVLNTLPVVFSI